MHLEFTLLIVGITTCLAHPGTPQGGLSQNGFSNREFSRGTNSQGVFMNRHSSNPNAPLRATNIRLAERPSLFEMPSKANSLLPKFSSSPRNTNPTFAGVQNTVATASLFERPNEANSLLPQLPSVARPQPVTPQISSTFTGTNPQRPVYSANRNTLQNQGPLPSPALKTSSLPRPQFGSTMIRANPALPGSSLHQANSNQRQVMPLSPRTSNPATSQRESMLNGVNPQSPQFPVHSSNMNVFQNQRQTALPAFQPSSSVSSKPRPMLIGATQQVPVQPLRPTNANSFQDQRQYSSTNFQTSNHAASQSWSTPTGTNPQLPELPVHSGNRNAFQNQAPVMPQTLLASRPAPELPVHSGNRNEFQNQAPIMPQTLLASRPAPELPVHSGNRNAFQNQAPIMPQTLRASRPPVSHQVPNQPRVSQGLIPGSIVILGYAGETDNSSSESHEDF